MSDYDEVYSVSPGVSEPKAMRISLHLIAKRHLAPDANSWPQDKILTELNKITHVRLDRENIGEIDSFELLGQNVRNLYLQHNRIERIDNLEYLQGLTFLTLASNQIRVIEGLTHLSKLSFLDLSYNLIISFDIDELPQSLVILNLKGNPCTNLSDYRYVEVHVTNNPMRLAAVLNWQRGSIIQDLPKLRQLDEEPVTKTERRETGYIVSEDEDEDSEEEEVTPARGTSTLGKAIQEVFSTDMSDILWRSQSRMEDMLKDHKKKMLQLDRIRQDNHLPPSPRSQQGHRS